MTSIRPSLLALMQEIVNPRKTADNPHYKSKFAPLDDLLTYLRPLLAKHGLMLVQTTDVRPDVGPVLVTTLWHVEGDFLSGVYPLKPMREDPQGYAAAMTFGRRYAIMGLLGIAGDDDDGEEASRPARKIDAVTGEVKKVKTKLTEEQNAALGAIRAEVIRYGGDEADAELKAKWKEYAYASYEAINAQLQAVKSKWFAIHTNKGAAP